VFDTVHRLTWLYSCADALYTDSIGMVSLDRRFVIQRGRPVAIGELSEGWPRNTAMVQNVKTLKVPCLA
jgi:hypothetical protein